MPQSLAGINVSKTRDFRLVQQEIFQRTHRSRQEVPELRDGESLGKRVNPERGKPWTVIGRFPRVHAPEMPAIGKTQNGFSKFECHIDVHAAFRHVRPIL